MPTQKQLDEEATEHFRELAKNREAIRNIYQYVVDTINQALQTKNYEQLFPLIEYIESGEGSLCYRYSGKLHRILKCLYIIQLEYKYKCPLFCDGCQDADSVYDKYVSCLYVLRRLIFRLSPESVEEAISFLHTNVLSSFAICTITGHDRLDRINATKGFYMEIFDLYRNIWSETEIQIFTTLTNLGGNTE